MPCPTNLNSRSVGPVRSRDGERPATHRGRNSLPIESHQLRKKPITEYKRFIQGHYDGFAGKLTGITGILTGHEALAGQVFKPKAFDLRGCKRILDAGCGNGRHVKYILRRGDPDAFITAFDLSQRMLKRASRRIKSDRVRYVAADLTRLPYPDGYFDAIV